MTLSLIAAAFTGLGLAACAGLRAFLPIFAAGIASRFFEWPLAESFRWVASDIALVVFGVATAAEIAADKIPVVDHALDAAQTLLAPVAGAVLAMSSLTDLSTPWAAAIGIATGAPIAGGVHLLAATTRLKSSALTAGTANPVLSVAEDALAIGGVVIAFVLPLLVLFVVLAVVVVVVVLRRFRRGRVPLTPNAG